MQRNREVHLMIRMILGDQPIDRKISPGHQVRVERAIDDEVMWGGVFDSVIIFTGGVTVPGVPTEAELAYRYYSYHSDTDRVVLEAQSRTTAQNFMLTLPLISNLSAEDEILIYCGYAQVLKVKILLWHLWDGELRRRVRLVPCPDHRGIVYIATQIFIGTALALLDPRERWIAKLGQWRLLRKDVVK